MANKKSFVKKRTNSRQKYLLHCWGGKGRAGTVAAILLIEFGEDNNEAIKIVRMKRKGAIESKKQEEFILNYSSLA